MMPINFRDAIVWWITGQKPVTQHQSESFLLVRARADEIHEAAKVVAKAIDETEKEIAREKLRETWHKWKEAVDKDFFTTAREARVVSKERDR